MKLKSNILFVVLAGALFTSCQSYKKIPYLQGLDSLKVDSLTAKTYEARVMPQDILSIVVSCTNAELAVPFNLTVQSAISVSQTNNNQLTTQPTLQSYLVDKNGDIVFPVLGKLHVAGLSRLGIESMIKEKLKDYIKEEPIVTVRMMNYRVSVLGEVTDPGTFTVNNEKVNIFEALALAHDMTVYGRRDNVHIIREDATGHRNIATVDLSNANIINSPYYNLQQNDIVYVTPNKAKATTADITSSTTIWFSVIGSLLSLAGILIAVFR